MTIHYFLSTHGNSFPGLEKSVFSDRKSNIVCVHMKMEVIDLISNDEVSDEEELFRCPSCGLRHSREEIDLHFDIPVAPTPPKTLKLSKAPKAPKAAKMAAKIEKKMEIKSPNAVETGPLFDPMESTPLFFQEKGGWAALREEDSVFDALADLDSVQFLEYLL